MAKQNRFQNMLRSEFANHFQEMKLHFVSKEDLRNELVSYIGPIFQELKADINELKADVRILKEDV